MQKELEDQNLLKELEDIGVLRPVVIKAELPQRKWHPIKKVTPVVKDLVKIRPVFQDMNAKKAFNVLIKKQGTNPNDAKGIHGSQSASVIDQDLFRRSKKKMTKEEHVRMNKIKRAAVDASVSAPPGQFYALWDDVEAHKKQHMFKCISRDSYKQIIDNNKTKTEAKYTPSYQQVHIDNNKSDLEIKNRKGRPTSPNAFFNLADPYQQLASANTAEKQARDRHVDATLGNLMDSGKVCQKMLRSQKNFLSFSTGNLLDSKDKKSAKKGNQEDAQLDKRRGSDATAIPKRQQSMDASEINNQQPSERSKTFNIDLKKEQQIKAHKLFQSNTQGNWFKKSLADMNKTTGREKQSRLEWQQAQGAHEGRFQRTEEELMPNVYSKYNRSVQPVTMSNQISRDSYIVCQQPIQSAFSTFYQSVERQDTSKMPIHTYQGKQIFNDRDINQDVINHPYHKSIYGLKFSDQYNPRSLSPPNQIISENKQKRNLQHQEAQHYNTATDRFLYSSTQKSEPKLLPLPVHMTTQKKVVVSMDIQRGRNDVDGNGHSLRMNTGFKTQLMQNMDEEVQRKMETAFKKEQINKNWKLKQIREAKEKGMCVEEERSETQCTTVATTKPNSKEKTRKQSFEQSMSDHYRSTVSYQDYLPKFAQKYNHMH